jgi:hypothetical protein
MRNRILVYSHCVFIHAFFFKLSISFALDALHVVVQSHMLGLHFLLLFIDFIFFRHSFNVVRYLDLCIL